MNQSIYWADGYVEKRKSADAAVSLIHPGQRIFIGSACGEPQALVRALSEATARPYGLEIVRLFSRESTSLTEIAHRTEDSGLTIRNIYSGSTDNDYIAKNRRFVTPMNMADIPLLFESRKMPIHVAMIQVSPPDDFGWMSLGISVDVTLAAARSADMVMAQVNPNMPRVLGQSFVHVNDVDVIVEHEEPLITVPPQPKSAAAIRIGQHIARLIKDGSTLQIGLGAASQATLKALGDKNDLGVHSQYLTDNIMYLYAIGIVNNRKKGFNEGKLVASAAIGSHNLYEFINDNPAVDFYPSDIVNDPSVIARHHRMVSMNVAHKVDLTGQAAAETSAGSYFSGVSGIPDFVRGAGRAPEGKSFLMLNAVSEDGKKSNIVSNLGKTAVVVPRSDVQYVVTEYGVVNLFGKSLQERVMAMIEIAHPDFREPLFEDAKTAGLIDTKRSLSDAAIKGVYPVWMEENIEVLGEQISIRPSKPVDERRIQEHYYNLTRDDILSRFFHEKHIFSRSEVKAKIQTDYVKDLTILCLVGEFGFGRVVALGESMYMPDSDMAEVAFSVNRNYQGKGLGRRILKKLADAARQGKISGLMAYTNPGNKKMIKLFKTLPYKVTSKHVPDGLKLMCRFDVPADETPAK